MVESDPLRFVGFRALVLRYRARGSNSSRPDCRRFPPCRTWTSFCWETGSGQNLFDVMAQPGKPRVRIVRIIVTGSGVDEETILKAIASGAKGYVG